MIRPLKVEKTHSFISEESMTPPSDANLNLLLFEDNRGDAELVIEFLEQSAKDYRVTVAQSLKEGVTLAEKTDFDLLILDLMLPDSRGIETLEKLLASVDSIPVVVLTGSDDEKLSAQALQAGAQDYLFKDKLDPHVLERTIRHSIERAGMLSQMKADDASIRQSEALLRQIFEVNTEAMLILSAREHQIKYLNPASARLLDATPEELLGAIFPFELRHGSGSELEIPRPDDSTSLVEISVVEMEWKGEAALLVVLRDITEHRRSQLAYKREKERLAITLDAIADAVVAIAGDGSIERINQEAARLLGIKNRDAVGKDLADVLRIKHPKTGKFVKTPVPWLLDARNNGIAPGRGLPMVDGNGRERLVSADMRCILDDEDGAYGCVLVLRDMTDVKRAEDELFQAEKLNSISLLAGGIAHDFNNILTAVLGNISVVRMGMDDENPLAGKLDAAEKAALQAKNLTQQLLTFSKGGAPVLETTSLDQVVEECSQFVLRGSNVRCEVSKDDTLWAVDADKGQIAQVINNLVINADQAMPNGGVIHIRMTNETLRMDDVPSLSPGEYLCISVRDEGEGISPENLKRIFDPYFTTKDNGNGLGLASAYSIIHGHNGAMSVQSSVGSGTTFKIYLPRSTEALPEPAAAPEPEDDTLHRGEGRILVMDDMEAMMMVAGEILSALGYEVEFSTCGEEAIEAYKKAKESGEPFDAVVFDLTVPGGMGGEEASEILLKYDPGLVAIASSGYTTSNVMSDYKNSAFKAVVPKPYRIKEMSAALRQALAG